jgi:hypothetical protein|tara:strand:- start:41 stop:256 length:216 start_codon:yes stop_codon:yes gene_type:complete
MRERIYKTMVQRYTSEIEDALLKIDMLMVNAGSNAVMVDHSDITGEVDKLLAKAGASSEKLGILRKFYSNN